MADLTPGSPIPNIWTTMQRWIELLPTSTTPQLDRRTLLSQELKWLVAQLGNTPGVGGSSPFVFAHCDLLSGNVIIEPSPTSTSASRRSSASSSSNASDPNPTSSSVSFIDYEYATPAPASFDLANHFAEWGGFDCDYSVLPTRSTRRAFLREYLYSYCGHGGRPYKESELEELCKQVDAFRGVPGFYWGIWALIQGEISLIEFDYKGYAEVRLGEYWGWKGEVGGGGGGEKGVRERRWAEE